MSNIRNDMGAILAGTAGAETLDPNSRANRLLTRLQARAARLHRVRNGTSAPSTHPPGHPLTPLRSQLIHLLGMVRAFVESHQHDVLNQWVLDAVRGFAGGLRDGRLPIAHDDLWWFIVRATARGGTSGATLSATAGETLPASPAVPEAECLPELTPALAQAVARECRRRFDGLTAAEAHVVILKLSLYSDEQIVCASRPTFTAALIDDIFDLFRAEPSPAEEHAST
jgi:hypothetical protein